MLVLPDKRPPLGLTPSIARLAPQGPTEYAHIADALYEVRPQWRQAFRAARVELEHHLGERGWVVLRGSQRGLVLRRQKHLAATEIVLMSRLKTVEALMGKMGRYGEPVGDMLDIWGFRITTADQATLDQVAAAVGNVWEKPSVTDLLLRGGDLAFQARRDYRHKTHTGMAPSTSFRYDEAIHINRRTTFGIVEIQVLTEDLYRRAFLSISRDEAHGQFVRRRDIDRVKS